MRENRVSGCSNKGAKLEFVQRLKTWLAPMPKQLVSIDHTTIFKI